ncbi:MAG: malonic semialdehyde reductase [Burkholderiales bacterium]|nr:malonic semialdehyde reductase [Burkholderiales bacterium]
MSDPTRVFARQLFTEARTHGHWLPRDVTPALLRELYTLAASGPTSMNTQPMRLKFVVSAAAKARLVACVNPGNVTKTQTAPVVAIVGQDLAFPEHLPRLFAHKADARSYYDGKPDVTASTALRNSSLQGAYLMLAARLLGLDCGPMSGFDATAVDRAFWSGSQVRTNFLCNLGYGDAAQLKPRPPRLDFDEVCELL